MPWTWSSSCLSTPSLTSSRRPRTNRDSRWVLSPAANSKKQKNGFTLGWIYISIVLLFFFFYTQETEVVNVTLILEKWTWIWTLPDWNQTLFICANNIIRFDLGIWQYAWSLSRQICFSLAMWVFSLLKMQVSAAYIICPGFNKCWRPLQVGIPHALSNMLNFLV